MKKRMKKGIGIILALAMLAALLPSAIAHAAEEVLTLPVTGDAGITMAAEGTNYNQAKEIIRTVYSKNSTMRMFHLVKADLTGLSAKLTEGKAVTKLEYCAWGYSPANNFLGTRNVEFYATSISNWDETKITMGQWIDNNYKPTIVRNEPYINGDGKVYGVIKSEPDASVSTAFTSTTAEELSLYTFDITSAYYAAFPNGITESSVFSFLEAVEDGNGNNQYAYFITKDNTEVAYRPYIKVTIGDIPQFTKVSDKVPGKPSEEFEFKASNNIASATVTINGAALPNEKVIINGNTLTIDYEYENFKTYEMAVAATDMFGQNISETYNFTVTYDVVSAETVSTGVYHVKSDKSEVVAANGSDPRFYAADDSRNSAFIYKFTLPEIKAGAYLESFKVTFWNRSNQQAQINARFNTYKYTSENDPDFGNLKYSDIKAQVEGNDAKSAGNVTLFKLHESHGRPCFIADVTAYANELIAAGKTTMYLIVNTPDATSTMGTQYYSGEMYIQARSYSEINENPSISVKDKDIVVSGPTLKKADISFITNFDNATINDYVELKKVGGSKIDAATFAFNKDTQKLSLSAAVALEAGAEYELVLKSGLSDLYGNTLSDDLVIQRFTAGKLIEVSAVKILPSTFDAENDDFDAAASLTTSNIGDSLISSVKITNNDTDDTNVMLFVASYKDGNKLESIKLLKDTVASEDSKVLVTEAISVTAATELIKAFVWQDDTYRPLEEVAEIDMR